MYTTQLPAARHIGNGSDARNTPYRRPEDERAPRTSLSLKGWYGGVSGVVCREIISPFEMCELSALPSAEYAEVGAMRVGRRSIADQCMIFARVIIIDQILEGVVGDDQTRMNYWGDSRGDSTSRSHG